jgi:hypothetical protein
MVVEPMRRREFITLLGGAAAARPLAARAQQKKIDRVGVLLLDNADAALSAFFLGVLRDELRKAGYVEQQNVLFDFVSAEGKSINFPSLLQLIRLQKLATKETGLSAQPQSQRLIRRSMFPIAAELRTALPDKGAIPTSRWPRGVSISCHS